MANRSMYTLSNQLNNSTSVDMGRCNEKLLFNLDDYYLNNDSSLMNSFMRSFDVNCRQPLKSPCVHLTLNMVDETFQLFKFINLGHLLIQSIKRENEIVRNMTAFDYSSSIIFHKVREIDLIKLLLLVQEKIEISSKAILADDTCFSKEVLSQLFELDSIFNECFFSQVNDVDVTEKFDLSASIVDSILHDCNSDLSELDRVISKIFQSIDKKQHSGILSRSRAARLFQKTIDSLQTDAMVHFRTIDVILDRLFYGHSKNITNFSHLNIPQDFLLEFHTEIDEKQYQDIVHLKHFHLELEQRTLSLILELTERQLMPTVKLSGQDNEALTKFNCTLSPIKSEIVTQRTPNAPKKLTSMLTSTPSLSTNLRRNSNATTDYDDLISEGDEPSVLSLDSGILPTSENDLSSITSQETLDVMSPPDDDYEKINDINAYNYAGGGLGRLEDTYSLGSISTNSECYKHSQQSVTRCSSLIEDASNGSIFSPQLSKEPPSDASRNMGFLNFRTGFDNYELVVNVLQLSETRREEMRANMKELFMNQDEIVKFNCALGVTIYMSRNQTFSDPEEILVQLEGTFFNLMNINIRPLHNEHNWSSVLDNQVNNSACSTYSISKLHPDFNNQNDQNTNNNADSKDDESSDLYTSSDELPNEHSACVDTNEISESPSNELMVNSNTSHDESIDLDCTTEKCNDTTVSDPTDLNWQQYDSLVATRCQHMGGDNLDSSLILEDIDLALKLSELHLKIEFENESTINSALVANKNKVIEKYKAAELKTRSRISELDPTHLSPGKDRESAESTNVSGDSLDVPLELSLSNNSPQSVCSAEGSLSENPSHDDESMSFSQRIQLTISLAKRLLSVTKHRLDLIASLSKNKNVRKMVSKKTLSIYSIRQRLNTVAKVLSNLEFSIKCSAKSENNHDCLSQIHAIVTDSEQLSQVTYKLEEHLNTTSSTAEDADNVDYLDELPDDLLVTLDPLEMESLLSISVGRLHVTMSALTHYPCYDMLIKSSLKKFVAPQTTTSPTKVHFKTPLSSCELIREIHKLRRVTAICALNIVDLHVIIAKIEENTNLGYEDKISEMKELLLVWRIIDKECHRLLRCNSLIQRVLMDSRRTYVELVSLTAVMVSITQTVDLNSSERTLLNVHLDNVHTYKLKIVDWLEELELCSSVLHRKRITNKRSKFYEDIHKFLEENLKSITDLADHIKLGCRETVKSLTTILAYCSGLSSFPVTVLDAALNTNNVLDNRHLDTEHCLIKSDILAAIADLEVTEHNVCHFQDLLDQGKHLFLHIIAGDLSVVVNEDSARDNTRVETNEAEHPKKETNIAEHATLNLTEKISTIATHAASKALLLFVDKNCAEQQVSSWSMTSENEDILDDAIEEIVDDITAMMTGLLVENVNKVDETYTTLSCKLIFNDVCRQLGDKALHFLVDNLLVDFPKMEDGFICDRSGDLAQYFSEELSHFMIDDCVNSLPLSESVSCLGSCVSKLEQKLSQRLFEKSVLYLANTIGSDEEERTQLNFPSPIPTYRLSRKVVSHSVSAEEVQTNEMRFSVADSLSTTNYSCDIRKCVFPPRTSRIASDKILKLVARFDRGVVEEEMTDNGPRCDKAIEREFSAAVSLESNEVEKELVIDGIEDCRLQHEAPENLGTRGFESLCALHEESVEHVTSSQMVSECYWTEVVSGQEGASAASLVSLKRRCVLEPRERAKTRRLCSPASEHVHTDIQTHKHRASIHEHLVQSCSSSIIQQHSALTHQRDCATDSASRIDEEHEVESDSDSNDTTFNMSITSSVNHKAVVGSLSIKLDHEVIRSVEAVLAKYELHSVSEMPPCTPCEHTLVSDHDSLLHCAHHSSLDDCSRHASSHTHQLTEIASYQQPQHSTRDYEASLSRLWLLIFIIFMLLLLALLFHDRINNLCRCLGVGPSLIPALVSPGLPF